MSNDEIKTQLNKKYNEAIRLSQEIDALQPLVRKDEYRVEYDDGIVNELITKLSTWQDGVKYLLQSVLGERHSAYLDFIDTITRKNEGFDYKRELKHELETGKAQLWTIMESLCIIIPKEKDEKELNNVWQIMHPMIIQVSQSRIDSGFYADAVVSAFKEINVKVRELYKQKSGKIKMELV